jgi:hypothetical protein
VAVVFELLWIDFDGAVPAIVGYSHFNQEFPYDFWTGFISYFTNDLSGSSGGPLWDHYW